MTPATKRKIAVQKGCEFQLRSRKERRFEFRAFLPKVDIRTAAAGILNTPTTSHIVRARTAEDYQC